ncbi:MAG: AAA family ATPase [Candidatus Microsaccharimonas sp.]
MKPLTPASPHAIIMVGIPGSGKSVFAERFAETFRAPIISATKLKRELELTDKAAQAIQTQIISEYLKTKQTFLVDGSFEKKQKRFELYRQLTKAGYRPLVVWVQTDPGEAEYRATKPYPKGSGLSADEFKLMQKGFQSPSNLENPIVISGKHTYATQLKIVLKQLSVGSDRSVKPPQKPPRPHGRQVIIR